MQKSHGLAPNGVSTARFPDEQYETVPWPVHALLYHLPKPQCAWDPCDRGDGLLIDTLLRCKINAVGTEGPKQLLRSRERGRRMKRLPRDQQKELADQARLTRAWKAFHAEQLEQALAGPHGAQISELMTLLNRLEPSCAAPLLAFIRRGDWSSVSYDTRLTVLHQINDRITRMRERHGLAPFDDPLPGLPDNVFRIVRAILAPSPAHERRLSPSEVATAERTGRDVTAAVQTKE